MVPRWFYYWAQAERKYPSFTALEKRMLVLFFYWAVSGASMQNLSKGADPVLVQVDSPLRLCSAMLDGWHKVFLIINMLCSKWPPQSSQWSRDSSLCCLRRCSMCSWELCWAVRHKIVALNHNLTVR